MAASAPLAARAMRMPCDIRAGARDWRLRRVQLQFKRACDARDAGRRCFLHRHWDLGRRNDLGRRECDRQVASIGGLDSIAFRKPWSSKRYSEATYLTVLPGLAAVLYFVTHPQAVRNAMRKRGGMEEAGAGPGILGLAWRDSRRWVYRGAEFSAGRPDSSQRSNTRA